MRLPQPYRDRWRMRGTELLTHLANELIDREAHWMGVRCQKNPLDAWVYQELLYEVRPEVVVELGNAFGGSALFLSHMLDLAGVDGAPVVCVDHSHAAFAAEHSRIELVTGRTDDPHVLARVRELCEGRRTLVIHDAAHDRDQVLADLRNYAPLVSSGSYLVVEDGAGELLVGGAEAGVYSAITAFLEEAADFEVDDQRERFLLTFNPRGFLRRK
jgi:cephalosporin hydroxylase